MDMTVLCPGRSTSRALFIVVFGHLAEGLVNKFRIQRVSEHGLSMSRRLGQKVLVILGVCPDKLGYKTRWIRF
jgi:hypothetical protein